VFEVFPMTRYTARKALKRVRRDKTSAVQSPRTKESAATERHLDSGNDPDHSRGHVRSSTGAAAATTGAQLPDDGVVMNAEVEESSRAETVQNEAIHSQLEGKVVKYGQVIQLQHLHNGKWLAARTKDCADLETDCSKVFLHKEGGSKCWFKLLPRISGKSEGDKVAVGDQIVLQHKKSGNMIHRSNMTNEAGDYEVNLATSLTVFTVAHSAAGGRRNLRAGQLIRLAHQESGYLSVLDQLLRLPASLTPSDHMPASPQVISLASVQASLSSLLTRHKDIVVKRPKRRRTNHRPPTSYDSVWQLESEYSDSSGTITWGTRCRLQLFGAQGHYLCLSEEADTEQQGNARGELRLTLTSDKHHVDTLFVFLPFGNKKSEDIVMGSYARVQHARTKTYLHASTSASMQLIGADDCVRAAVCSQQLHFNDVFGVHAVAQSQVEIIGFVNKRRLGRIEEYVSRLRQQRTLSDSELNSTHSVLVDLIRFCTFPPPPDDDPLDFGGGIHVKPHQKVLGSPAVLALLLDAATVPFAHLGTRDEVQAQLQRDQPVLFVTKLLWNLLARIALRNSSNGVRLMRFLPRMVPFLGMQVGVERCLMEMFRENAVLLNALTPAHLRQIMHMLFAHGAALPNIEGLSLLQVLCSCGQGPLSNNQNAIVSCLLDEFPYVLVRSRLHHGQLQLCNADSVGRRVAVHRAAAGAQQHKHKRKHKHSSNERWEDLVNFTYDTELREHLVYYVHVLSLLAHLCLGRNYCAIAAVAGLVRFEEAFTGLADSDLPYNVRAAYSQILLHCYVDCFPQRAADIQLVWSVSSVTRDDQRDISVVPAPHAATEVQLARLKDLLRNMLANDRIPAFPCFRVYMHLVALVRSLMHFRFYTLQELETDIMPRLTEVLLEGGIAAEQKKWPGEQRQALMRTAVGHSPYRNEETALLVDILLEVCHTFKVYYRLRLKELFSRVMHQLQEESVGEPEDADVRTHLREVIGLHMEASEGAPSQHHNFDEAVFSSALVQLLKHQNNRLSSAAVDLLLNVQTRQVHELYALVPRVQLLLDDDAVHTAAAVECELLPMLQQFASQPHTADRQAQVKNTIGKLVNMCLVTGTRDPHPLNQRLLRHLNVHEAIFRILEMPLDPASFPGGAGGALSDSIPPPLQPRSSDGSAATTFSGGMLGRTTTAQLPSIFRGCYAFLRLFCYQNRQNQQELYPKLQFFLGQLPLCLGGELTITELFRNNRALCQRVTPAVLDPLFTLLLTQGPRPSVLRFFQAVVVAEGSPIRSNQTAVVRRLMQHPELLRVDADDPAKLRALCARWRGDESKEPGGELGYHLQLMHLLARCSLGKSHECEIVCQNLISVERCLEVLNDHRMNAWVKAAYATFLDEVWLNTAVADAVVLLQNMTSFWQYLSECRDLLVAFCEALTPHSASGSAVGRSAAAATAAAALSPEEAAREERERHLSTAHAPRGGQVSVTGSVVSGAVAVGGGAMQRRQTVTALPQLPPEVVRVTASNLRSVTEYIFHAVLPLLQHFYGTHFVFEKAPPLHTTIANQTVDVLCLVFRTSITAKDKLLQAASCLEVLLSQGITGHEVFLMTDSILEKVRLETRRQARRLPQQILKPARLRELDLVLSAVPPRFWRLDEVYGNVVALMQENRSRPGDFEEIAVAIIRNPDYCKLSLQLAALRFLRYFVCALPLPERTALQNLLDGLDAVPAAVALLGSDDDEVVSEALELLVALMENNDAVRRSLMESYLDDMRDESFFPDMRTLIQKSLTTLNRQKQWRRQRADITSTHAGSAAAGSGGGGSAVVRRGSGGDGGQVDYDSPSVLSGSMSKRRLVQRQKTRVHDLTRLLSSGSLAYGGGSSVMVMRANGELIPNAAALGPRPKDSPFIFMAFRVIELLCEGHVPRIQRYMREQPDNFRSFDLVKQCVQYFQAFESEICQENIELAIQLATTLKVGRECSLEVYSILFFCYLFVYLSLLLVLFSLSDALLLASPKLLLWTFLTSLRSFSRTLFGLFSLDLCYTIC
jgi:Inositol 1,4,5-trisphosphate/ryanodine receptor/RIH domain/RyR and IP3R Homology associated